MLNYGESLKYKRELANINQPDLAKKIGTSQQNISRWEKGQVIPGIDFCVKLADFYNISLDELIGRDNFAGAIVVTKYIKSEISDLYEQLNHSNQIMALGMLTALLQKQING